MAQECPVGISKHNEWNLQPIFKIHNSSYRWCLSFSESIYQHFKHLNIFFNIVRNNSLVLSALKMKLFQARVRFLRYDSFQGTIKPIHRSIEFVEKFLDELKDKTQLQRILGCLNYISDFYPNLRLTLKPLF